MKVNGNYADPVATLTSRAWSRPRWPRRSFASSRPTCPTAHPRVPDPCADHQEDLDRRLRQDYPPMLQFLWGLTPAMCDLTGRDLLPTYNYFRLYRKDDICRVHSDRDACEHSLSLTLGYSDGQLWPFEVGRNSITRPRRHRRRLRRRRFTPPSPCSRATPCFIAAYSTVTAASVPTPTAGRRTCFLHWVDRHGPHAAAGVRLRQFRQSRPRRFRALALPKSDHADAAETPARAVRHVSPQHKEKRRAFQARRPSFSSGFRQFA